MSWGGGYLSLGVIVLGVVVPRVVVLEPCATLMNKIMLAHGVP